MYTARALVPRDLCCGRKQTAPQVMGGGGGGGDACCCCISSRLLRLRSSLSAARRLRAFSLSSRSLSFRLLSSLCPSRRRLFSRSAFFWTSRVSASRAAWRSLLRSPLRQHWGGIWRKARKKRIDRNFSEALEHWPTLLEGRGYYYRKQPCQAAIQSGFSSPGPRRCPLPLAMKRRESNESCVCCACCACACCANIAWA